MKSRLIPLLILLAALLPAGPAAAHPHVWIEASVILHMKDGKIVAVSHKWEFDPRFSIVLLDQFDKNRNRHFEKTEIADVKANGFTSLKRLSYFTHVRVGQKYQTITNIPYFEAEVSGQKVVYVFTARLETPIDPRKTKADFLFLDRSYYVDVAAKKAEIRGEKGCSVAWSDDTKNPIYYGLVIPKMLNVTCAAS